VRADVLVNGSDADGDALTVKAVGAPQNGSAVLNPDGTITYTPDADYHGSDTFTYDVVDGQGGTATAVVTVTGSPMPTIFGTNARDVINLSAETIAHEIWGAGGHDVITGSQAGDTIVGGSGDDVLNGAGGDDVFVYEGSGNGGDQVDGGAGFDVLSGGDGNDVFGFRGIGVVNAEKIDGGAGFNVIQGEDNHMSRDTLDFSSVALVNIGRIEGRSGHDIIIGSAGGDNLVDGSGQDQLSGGGGADTFALTASDLAVDTINDFSGAGGDGDVIDLVAFGANASVAFDPISRILTVNGEDVARIIGDFDPLNDVRGGSGNAAPLARDDFVVVAAGVPVTLDLLDNDDDPDGDQLTITSFSKPAHGTLTQNSPLTYMSSPDFVGTDMFTYLVSDGNGGTAKATATITVTVTAGSVNHVPVAKGDSLTTNEDTSATLDVLANDTAPNSDTLTVKAVGAAANGSATLNVDGTITYAPGANFHGTDTFTYTVSDGNGGTVTAAVQVTVNAVNDAPVAAHDTFTVAENGTLNANSVLDNDHDVDGDGLSAALVSGPNHGTLSLNTNGTFSYTPAGGFVGTDSFAYRASDGHGGKSTASVTVNVNAPGGLSDLVASMDPGEWKLIPGSDMNQVLLTLAEHDQIVNEAIAANPGVQFAEASFWGGSGSKSVINAWNSAAYDLEGHRWFFMGGGHADYGGNEVYEYDFDTLQWTRLTDPSALIVKQSDGVPIPAVGPVSVHTYDSMVWNPTTDTMWLTGMKIGFRAPGTPPNPEQKAVWEFDPDTGVWTPHTLDKNLNMAAATFLPGDDVIFVADSGYSNNHGYFIDVSGNYTIANNGAQFGNYSQQSNMFKIPDSASSGLAGRVFESHKEGIVEFTLDAAAATASVTTPQAIPDLGFDKRQAGYVFNPVDELVYVWNGEREVYTWDIATDSWHTLYNSDSSIAPDGDLSGAGKIFDKWIYLDQQGVFAGIHDSRDGGIWLWKPDPGHAGSTNVTPNAIDDSAALLEDTAKTIDVLANDADPDGDPLSVSSVGTASRGSAVLNANGSITYTPVADFHGTDTFTYTVSDGNGGSDTATVVVVVNPVNDAPVAANDIFTVSRDGTLNASSVLGNDQDADGDTLSAALVSGPAKGSLVLNTNGTFSYTPTAGFVGTDSFAYQARDGHGATDTASVNITVSASTGVTGEITTIQLQSVSGALTAGELVSFGQAFAVGDIQAWQGLALEVNGQTIAAQMDVKATHADGSVRHAIVTTEVPAGVTGNSVEVSLVRGVSSTAAPDAQTVASTLLASGYDLTVEVTLGGQTFVADAAAALSAAISKGLDVWMNGDLATEFRVDAAITGELHAYFDIRTHANGEVRTDVIIANDWVTSGGSTLLGAENSTYDVAIKQNGQTVESHANLDHYQQSEWHTQIWADGSAPNARVVFNPEYLMSTGAVPTLDTSIQVDEAELQKQYDKLQASDTGPMGEALWQTAMGAAGDRPDIGLVTNWTAQYLVSQDARAEAVMMAQADAAGSVPWHFRDPATDRVITITDYPGISLNATTVPHEKLAVDYSGTGWVPDAAHQYDMTYVPYVVTGDRFYLDQIQAEATFPLLYQTNINREGAEGIIDHGQIRALAWGLRALSNAAYITPDNDSLKSYFDTVVQNNMEHMVEKYITNGFYDAAGELEGYVEVYSTGRGPLDGIFSAWMDDYVTLSLGLIAQRGNAEAEEMLDWKNNWTAGRFTSEEQGFDPRAGTIYQHKWNDGTNLYDTWKGMYDANVAAYGVQTELNSISAFGYAASARGALATLITETGNPQAIEAYGFVVGETEDVLTTSGYRSDSVTPKYVLAPQLSDGSYIRHENITVDDASDNTIITGSGSQLLHAKGGDDFLSAGDGIDLVFGGDGNDSVDGGPGDDFVFGGNGDDSITGGSGNDYLMGNQGADVFNFARLGDGKDIIADFEVGIDHIHIPGLSGSEAESILAIATTDADGNAVLHLSAEDSITLQGLDVTQLDDGIWH